jgi:NAD(P)-dependent dehydrogenase (short-subunit alcohol dehydrogenase family)
MSESAFDLTGKVALVTGGNGGIGLAMAEAMAAAGADICIWGSNADKTAQAGAQIERHGRRVLALACDVSDEAAVEAATAETVATLGRIDACFANAGVAGRAPSFLEMTAQEWRRVLSVNLDGVFFTFRAAARRMVEQGDGGALVVTSSLASIEGQPRGEHYAASKGGVVSMMRALAVELARHKIRANAILPGWIETDMTRDWMAQEVVQERVLKRVPARRWGVPQDFGAIAVYLASDASAYHSGDTLLIDGAYALF